MGRPTAQRDAVRPASQHEDLDEPLEPTPDNGKPFVGPTGRATSSKAKAGAKTAGKAGGTKSRHLSLRITEDLFEELKAASERSGIPQARIVERGIRAQLEDL